MAMFLTNPEELGPFGITVWFTVFLLVLAGAITLLLYWIRGQQTTPAFMRALRRGFFISIWATGLLALGSLRQLTIRDIILITVLVVVIDFYMRRMQQ